MHSSLLNELANQFGSDKGSQHGDRHRFAQIYHLLLGSERHNYRHVVEIGLAQGIHEYHAGKVLPEIASPSVRMWLDYFPSAQITGIDMADFSFMEGANSRFKFMRADSGNEAQLKQLAGQLGSEVDLLIDDASHASFHQQLALRELFPCIRSGGYYVIEDLHWQPPHLETSLPLMHRTSDWLEQLRQNRAPSSTVWTQTAIDELGANIDACVVFRDTQVPGGRFLSSVAILRKK